MRKITGFLTAMLLAPISAHAFTPTGNWQIEGQQDIIEFKKCGESLCGFLSYYGPDETFIDDANPDPSLQKRSLCQIQLISGLKSGEEGYEDGKIYDPESGSTYDLKLSGDNSEIKMRAYEGTPLLGETITLKPAGKFKRCKAPKPAA